MNHRAQYSNPFGNSHIARITRADGTLIRHFLVRLASAMSPLPVRMISSSVGALLVFAVVLATLLETGLMRAPSTAVALSAVARHADKERLSAVFLVTKTP